MRVTKKILLMVAITFISMFFSNNITTKVNAANVKTYKFSQFGSEKFYKIKDVAEKTIDVSKIKTSKTYKFDLDKDGKKDKITIKNSDKYVNTFSIYINNKFAFLIACDYGKIYLVDLNKNDKKVDIVVSPTGQGTGDIYGIFQKQGKKVKELESFWGTDEIGEYYINKKGKIVARNAIFLFVSPFVTDRYYYLSTNGKITTKKLNVKNISSKTYKTLYKGVEFEYKNKIKKLNKNTKFKIIDFIFKDEFKIKVKLNDGRVGNIIIGP